MQPLDVLKAIDGGARLWVGPQVRDATAVTRRAFRMEVTKPGADPAAAAARVLDKVMGKKPKS